MYHIIADGWSMEILKQEFRLLYDRIQQGKDVNLEPLHFQYTDFSIWQNKQVNNLEIKEKAHNYWREKLEEGFPLLRLPYDYPEDPLHSDNSGKAYRFVIHQDILKKMKTLAAENHTTLFMVMFSAINLLLASLSGQKEIVCRLPTAGRLHASLHPIVGYFINPIFIKNHIEDNHYKNFPHLLQQMEAETLLAFQHQWYPLELVVEEHQLNYPEIAISVNMLNMFSGTVLTDLEDFNSFHTSRVTDEKFPIILQFMEFRNGIELFLRYKNALFKPATIESIVSQYNELLNEITNT
jgi:hypothetical protein